MEYVGRLGSLFTSVQSFYNEINPATLSGAIDIVVVEQQDGDLACSPFHVRFGKLSVLMPQEKRVHIKVNGESVPYVMKVGEAGEAFFVFETEHEVPEEFQTSPIMEATTILGKANEEDPPYLDIGESKDSNNKTEKDENEADTFEDEEDNTASSKKKKLALPAELQSPKMIIEEQMDKVVTKMDPYNTNFHQDNTTDETNPIDPPLPPPTPPSNNAPTPKNDIYPMDDGSSLLERVIPESITTTTVAKERFIVRPSHGDIYSTCMDVTHAAVHENSETVDNSTVEASTGHGKGDESIVLDIAGYKTGGTVDEEETEEEKETKEIDEVLEKEILNKLFIDTETKKDKEPMAESPLPMDDEEEKKPLEIDSTIDPKQQPIVEKPAAKSLWGWGRARRRATNEFAQENTEMTKAEESDKPVTDLEMLPGQTYRIEMSLCGFSEFGKDEKENARVFDQDISSYDNFTHNPNILNDKRLVFRYEDRYYAAGRTGPLFTSLLLFKKPIEETESGTSSDGRKDVESTKLEDSSIDDQQDSRESYQFGKGWRQWLSRSSVAAPSTSSTVTNNNTNAKITAEDEKDESNNQQETTTFTTTTTTTSVGWTVDHVHPGQELQESFPTGPRKVYAKTLRLTSDQLKSLSLKKGVNTITFSVSSAYQGTATCVAKIFYWDYGISVVISDIDGTITKSDTLGHVFTMIGKDWTHMGVAKLYTDIANNGYHFLYLTSRAIGQADSTRGYLKSVAQNKYQLPDGPVIMSPDRLFTSLHREVIIRKPEVFKMACLKDIQRLFGGRDPFYGGFGNRITDARSYRSVNVPTSRIFTIDPYGDLKLELLLGFKSSYIHLNDLVDQIFPPINRAIDDEFTDWNYWKVPMIEIDIPELNQPLEPTSPKPKPIKPDPTSLPASSVVASTSTGKTGRSLLRSFTSLSDSSSTTVTQNASSLTGLSNRKLSTSSSTPTLLTSSRTSRKFSMSSNSSGSEKAIVEEEESSGKDAIDAKGLAAATSAISVPSVVKEITNHLSSPPEPSTSSGSTLNKMISNGFGGVKSTLSRTFLSSNNSSSSSGSSNSSTTSKVVVEELEEKRLETTHDDEKTLEEMNDDEKTLQEDVDLLLDDIDMDGIPFI